MYHHPSYKEFREGRRSIDLNHTSQLESFNYLSGSGSWFPGFPYMAPPPPQSHLKGQGHFLFNIGSSFSPNQTAINGSRRCALYPPCHCQCSVLRVFKAIATRIRGKSKQTLKSLKIEPGTSHSESRALANWAMTAPLEGTCISRLLLGRMSNMSPLEITSLEVQASYYTPKAFDLHFYNHFHPDFGRVERHNLFLIRTTGCHSTESLTL